MRWAAKLGWQPADFDSSQFDKTLVDHIFAFQTGFANLKDDGICGPLTFRRLLTEKESKTPVISLQPPERRIPQKTIIINGKASFIRWERVNNLIHNGTYALPRGFRKWEKEKRPVKMIVTHWDVCLSAKSCRNVLKKKGISSHFVIDNDGTICQMVDPQHEALHAGSRRTNRPSIGIDISNAYYPKYQKWYIKNGHGARPVLTSRVHGKTVGPHLGWYPVQLEAYAALVDALSLYYKIPLECPLDENGKLLGTVHPPAQKEKYSGVVSHYHLTKKKIDCAGLRLDLILSDIRHRRQ